MYKFNLFSLSLFHVVDLLSCLSLVSSSPLVSSYRHHYHPARHDPPAVVVAGLCYKLHERIIRGGSFGIRPPSHPPAFTKSLHHIYNQKIHHIKLLAKRIATVLSTSLEHCFPNVLISNFEFYNFFSNFSRLRHCSIFHHASSDS